MVTALAVVGLLASLLAGLSAADAGAADAPTSSSIGSAPGPSIGPAPDLTVGNSDAPGAISQPPPSSSSSSDGAVTSAATVYTFGRQPLDDVNSWAAQKAACGLTGPQLATMMLAPTYPETGATGSSAPSPMTLSRYDTQAGLYAFGDPATSYPRAFWHPGVGVWAFDSAGGWNLTAAQAISTTTSAQQAAITMSARWCAASAITDPVQRRASVWAPWFGCNSGACEAFYQAMYDPAGPKVQVDDTVTRNGGMVARTCRVPGFGEVACSYVDPAKAQGFNGWNVPSWGRSPVSAPFYVFALNGREFRVWLRNDTGYDATISASKPITSNARTALQWLRGDGMCDVTTNRGACNWTGWLPHGGTWQGKPAVATNPDGRLEMFAIAQDGSVYDAWQLAPNGDWSGWAGFPGLTGVKEIVASRGTDGFLVLAAVTSSGGLWQNGQRAGGWSGWNKIGNGLAGSLAVARNQDGRAEVYGLDAGGTVWHSWQLTGGDWSGLAQLGGHSLTALATAANQDGRIEVFAVGGDHAIYHVWQIARNAPFSGWQHLGGSVQGTPTTVNDLDGRIEVLTRGTDGQLYDVWQTTPNGIWSGVSSLGGQISGDPAVVRNRDGRLELFAPLPDGSPGDVWQTTAGGTWSSWVPFGGATTRALVGTNNADGHLVLVQVATDAAIYRNLQLV
ncbi:MAG: hypothetical protein ACXWB2_03325 [Acidimicrobiales bacterium]